MPDDTKPKAPYLPYTTFRRFLNSLNAAAIPSRIDKTLMPGQSGSIQSWVISGLKFFDLITDNGTPKDSLSELVKADETSRRSIWKAIFEKAYEPIIEGLDLQRTTLGMLNERFGKDFSAETVRKCQSFFSAAAEEAGIPLAEHLKPKGRSTGARKTRKGKATPTGSPTEAPNNGNGSLSPSKPGVARLLLDPDGTRFFSIEAPATVTKAELARINSWLGFQLIVSD